VSLGTYWLGARKTRGAAQERVRGANTALVASLIRRIALERQVMPGTHYAYLRSAKARESGIAVTSLLNFEQAKADVFSAVVSNEFLDVAGKNSIIELLSQSVDDGSDNSVLKSPDDGTRDSSFASVLSLGVSLAFGVGALFLSLSIDKFMPLFRDVSKGSGWTEIGLLALVAIFVGARLIAVLASPDKPSKPKSSDIEGEPQ